MWNCCSICRDCLFSKKEIVSLTCGHCFHKECLVNCVNRRKCALCMQTTLREITLYLDTNMPFEETEANKTIERLLNDNIEMKQSSKEKELYLKDECKGLKGIIKKILSKYKKKKEEIKYLKEKIEKIEKDNKKIIKENKFLIEKINKKTMFPETKLIKRKETKKEFFDSKTSQSILKENNKPNFLSCKGGSLKTVFLRKN